jgi:DNA polymerase-3 subunit delta
MFYLLYGNDEFSSREHLKILRQQGNFEYNQDTYNGAEVGLMTITATCNTMPFLADQRLVVVEGLPKRRRGDETNADSGGMAKDTGATSGRGEKRKAKKSKSRNESRAGFEKGLAEYVPLLPSSTVLIVLVDEELNETSPLLKAAQVHGEKILSMLPKGAALESWISKRAKSIGLTITPEAIVMLANYVGNQLRLLANELDKLATYAGDDGTIGVDEVRKLSPQVQEARVFDLTDALAQRNRKQALDILHDLLADGEPALRLISTITSQVRSLLLVKELAEKGQQASQIASATGMAPFVAEKALRQIGKFSWPQLEGAYRQLLATDAALKRSRLTPDMALDLLVVQFGTN